MIYGDRKFRYTTKRDLKVRQRNLAIQTAVWGGVIGGVVTMMAAAVTTLHS